MAPHWLTVLETVILAGQVEKQVGGAEGEKVTKPVKYRGVSVTPVPLPE